MIVMKFGGTSVEDARSICNVSKIVLKYLHRSPIVVASACAGVTNALISLATSAVRGGRDNALGQVEQLRVCHRKIAHELFTGDVLFTVQSQIDAMMDELRDITKSIGILGELTDRSLDTFTSFGERLSTLLLFHQSVLDGIDCVLMNAQEIVITNNEFTKATPLFDEIANRVETVLRPRIKAGQVVITQGFLGATRDGIPTTLGRGGSDYSAAIIGAALGAEEIQIWTDVDGVMTCDPRVVPNAQLIDRMSFREAAELAYFGAKVLHPSTILPAVKKDIPVHVLNSKRPQVPGTIILREFENASRSGAKAIAFKEHITLINIDSTRMLMTHGFLAKVFEVFARHTKSVDVIATSEVSISLTVDNEENLDQIVAELSHIADVELSPRKAIFCVVGEGLKDSNHVLTRIFSTLENSSIPVSMVSLGASEINMTFVVDQALTGKTAQALHNEFFPIN